MMKHKSVYLCILALLSGLLVLAVASLSLSASPPKATGGVGFTASGLERWLEFNAHADYNDHAAKGMVNYKDANGDRYKVDVQCVTVVDEWAYFSGPIVSTNRTDWEGLWALFAVFDGGTPGRKGDKVFGTFANADPGCQPFFPPVMFDVEKGNLVVH